MVERLNYAKLPSLEHFHEEYVVKRKPVVIFNYVNAPAESTKINAVDMS